MCRATLILGERERTKVAAPRWQHARAAGEKSGHFTAAKIPLLFLLMPPDPSLPAFIPRVPSSLSPPVVWRARTPRSFQPSSIPEPDFLRVPGIIMKGSSKRKSIDDGARSSSFNPHRAHERNPLVYQAEIKSLAAVAKSIIPWRVDRKRLGHHATGGVL